jgi:hypothetical protein
MKKLIIFLLVLSPIIGYSQSDVFGNTSPTVQFGNHSTFQGVSWRDKLPFERSAQDRIGEARGRNQNRTYRIGRNPTNIRKMKWKKWNRQRRRAFKRINVWG